MTQDRTFANYMDTRTTAEIDAEDVFLFKSPGSPLVWTANMDRIASTTITLYPPPGENFQECAGGAQAKYVPIEVVTAGPTGPVELVIDEGGSGVEINLGGEWREVPAGTAIELTPGGPGSPLTNYVYAEWTGSTIAYQAAPGGWPTGEHWRIAAVTLGTAADVFADPIAGILGVVQGEGWLCNCNGLLMELVAAIQARDPVYLGGGEVTFAGSGTANLTAGVAAVKMIRVREVETVAAPAPARFFVPVRGWINSDIVSSLLTLRDGSPITSNRRIVVTIGVAAGDDGAQDHLWLGLPTDEYSNLDLAKADAANTGDYSVPDEYRGTGILVARAVIHYLAVPSTVWTVEHQELIAVPGASGSSQATHFYDTDFRVLSAALPAAELAFDLSGLSAGTTSIAVPPSVGGTLMILVAPPATPSSPGEPGQCAVGGGYFYAYISPPGLWGRAPLATSW